jgi:Ni/Co efflux regulator RcnB
MKKIVNLLLGLSLVAGTVAFAQEKKTTGKPTQARVTHNTARAKNTKDTKKKTYKITRGSPK